MLNLNDKRVKTVKKLILLAALLALPGCSTVAKIADYGAAANDEAVNTSVFTICQAASVGAIRRHFDTEDKVQTWQDLCSAGEAFKPTPPSPQP